MSRQELYLNHAGTSWPKPAVVSEAVQAAMQVSPGEWPYRFQEAHQAIADFFGVHQREQILLTPGCTSALSVGLSDLFIEPGRRVLTSRWEHHALHRPLLKLASTGVPVDYIPAVASKSEGRQTSLDLDWLERELARQDVGLVAITAACNVTGELLPFDDVIRLAQRYGSMVLVDAAQMVGWYRLNLPEIGADLVAFGGHKGLQAPWGVGGLFISEHARMACVSASCDLPIAGQERGAPTPRPGYCDVGSVDQFALAGLHASVRRLHRQDLGAHLANGRRQIRRIRASLEGIDGLRFFGAQPDQGIPALALMHSETTSSKLASLCKDHGLIVGSGLLCSPLAHETLGTQASGLIRVSVGLGQPDEQIDEAIERLRWVFNEPV